MLTAREMQYAGSQTNGVARKDVKSPNELVLSEKFLESFHEAAMEAAEEIKKGKKPKFVKVA